MDAKRPQFGCRVLVNDEDVFQHNTWDKFEWDEGMIEDAAARIEANGAVLLEESQVGTFVNDTGSHWDKFYGAHETKFFKDRHWLLTECPELLSELSGNDVGSSSKSAVRILEVACGVGNTIFPLFEEDKQGRLRVYACDISSKAIDLLLSCPFYEPVRDRCSAFVCDISDDVVVKSSFETAGVTENSLDFITLVFALSAIRPTEHRTIIQRLASYLKPGGVIFFRDYAKYDLAQLRFKLGQCIGNNHYVRRDGTLSYFFSMEEAAELFESVGMVKRQLHIDSRLIVNRKRRLRMYRMWLQGCFVKPQLTDCAGTTNISDMENKQ